MGKEYYTRAEVAEIFRVSPQTIRRKIKAGKIKAIKLGREWRIPAEEVRRLGNEGVS